jgi:hypothetical protein
VEGSVESKQVAGVLTVIMVITLTNKIPGSYKEIRGCGVDIQMSTRNFL